MARLVIFDESVRGVDLPSHPVILGRSQKADIPIHDKILSRKHCTIVPSPSGLRLIDLKSSNGTYLNGKRVERSSLKFDDVIEIGNTVIVILDNDIWSQGGGVAGLRNPLKAQKIVQALKNRNPPRKDGRSSRAAPLSRPQDAGPEASREPMAAGAGGAEAAGAPRRAGAKDARRLALRDRKKLRAFEAVFAKWAKEALLSRPAAQELLEGYVFHHIVSLAARHSSELREALAATLERVLGPEAFSGDAAKLRETIRRAVLEVLERHREAMREAMEERRGSELDEGPRP